MRPIDADALSEIVEDGLRNNPHKGGLERVCHRTEYTHFLDVICRMPTIAPPPNAPLTPEQLREMDGSVWICYLQEIWGPQPATAADISCTRYKFTFDTYGKTWLAYRRRPEEGTP